MRSRIELSFLPGQCGVGFVEVSQANLTLLAIKIGQEAVHRGMRRISTEDEIGPFNAFIFVTVRHHPLGCLASKFRVARITEHRTADLVEPILVDFEAIDDKSLIVCLNFPSQPGEDQHSVIVVSVIVGVSLYRLVEVIERAFEPT